MIEQFFNKLSQCLRKENHLSDVTWAIAETCPTFQQLFLNFFFKDIAPVCNIEEFKREYTSIDCRPDFYIKADDKEYIIEVKIYDESHHFEQYYKRFPEARIGYIANYKLPEKEGFEIRTWKELKAYLNIILADIRIDLDTRQIINAYISYLTSVCSLYEIKETMNLENLSSLSRFNGLI